MSQPASPWMPMSRVRQKIDRIRESVPMENVLLYYGYRVHDNAGGREQQFPCDLHGDGNDNRPSARAYPDHFYCWACQRSRDAIDLVQIKEGVSFKKAVRILEERYGLPSLPWPDDPEEGEEDVRPSPSDEIEASLKTQRSFEQEAQRVERLMEAVTTDRLLPMRSTMRLWSLFDKVRLKVRKEEITEDLGKKAMAKLRGKIMEKLSP